MKKEFEVNIARAVSQFKKALKGYQIKKLIYKLAFGGKGLEFESFRKYIQGDDASLIDWKASLRVNDLFVRQYIEERDINVYFVVDVSNSMLFGSAERLKAEYVIEVAAALGNLVLESDDKLGLIMFTDKVVKILPPAKTKNQFYLFTKFLTDVNLYGGNKDFINITQYLLKLVRPPAVVIFISDFIHLRKGFERNLNLLGYKCESMAIMVRDPFDEELPIVKNQIVVQDPYSNSQLLIEPKIVAEKYKASALRQKKVLNELLRKSAIDLLELNTSESFIIPLVTFLKSRVRRKRIW